MEDGEKYKPYSEKLARQLCREGTRSTRLSVAKEHGNFITQIVKLEEQLAGFTQQCSFTGQLEGFTVGPSKAQEVWQELQLSLHRVDRLEELVGWWRPVQP